MLFVTLALVALIAVALALVALLVGDPIPPGSVALLIGLLGVMLASTSIIHEAPQWVRSFGVLLSLAGAAVAIIGWTTGAS